MISRRDFLRSLVAGSLLLAGCRPNEDDAPAAPSPSHAAEAPATGSDAPSPTQEPTPE